MGGSRGFLINHRVNRFFRRRSVSQSLRVKPLSGLIRWARSKGKAVLLHREKPEPVPKGYMAVYVGQKDGDSQRFLVPVVHFNDPLFGDLLKESENEFGFDQPGGLAIPCRISEFERVQTRINTVQCTRKLLRCIY